MNSETVLGLAPMAGMTDWPMRVLCYRMGANYACSEMVSAMGLMCAKPGNMVYRHLLAVHPEETNTACQLFGRDPSVMAEAAQRVTGLDRFKSIDINMGCPARKVVHSGEGSALLLKPDLAYRIMEAVKNSTHLPVTVKTRLGYDEDSMNAAEIGKAAQSLGYRWLCVHGRTRQQQYSGKADYAAIARVREQLTIPVIANGDVFSGEEAAHILRYTGADMAMIGRGSFGNPWLFAQCQAALEGKEIPQMPPLAERCDLAVRQIELALADKGERIAILEARRHYAWYLKGVPHANYYKDKIVRMNTMEDVYEVTRGIKRDLR